MSQLRHLKESPQDIGKVMVMTSSEKKSSASIAILLASNGADLYARNKKNQSPLDLCPDPNLLKLLTKCHHDYIAANKRDKKEQEANLTECMVCSDNKRDTVFGPCGHVVTCFICASRVKKCLLCKEQVLTRTRVEECLVCSETTSSVLFKPCLHMVACEGESNDCIGCKNL